MGPRGEDKTLRNRNQRSQAGQSPHRAPLCYHWNISRTLPFLNNFKIVLFFNKFLFSAFYYFLSGCLLA